MTCVAIPDIEVETTAKYLYLLDAKSQIPKILVTDNGSLCIMLRVKKLHVTPYNPQTNGSLKRSHKPSAEYLWSFVDLNGLN